MKLKAIGNFMMNDSKTGQFVHRKIGDEFSMDESKEGELLHDLIMMGRVTVIDDHFVPVQGEYIGLHQVVYTKEDGTSRRIDPGDKIKLPQETAVKLMVSGHVKPSNENSWRPQKICQATPSSGSPKKMFDDPPIERESWAMKKGRA